MKEDIEKMFFFFWQVVMLGRIRTGRHNNRVEAQCRISKMQENCVNIEQWRGGRKGKGDG